MISKKRNKINFGTAMHIEYNKEPKYIVDCQYFNKKTGYCKRNGVLVWDYGSEVCEDCNFNRKFNEDIKVREKKKDMVYELNKRTIYHKNKRTRAVLKIAKNHCERCGNVQKPLRLYIIDLDKPDEDKDSILNIIALCDNCADEMVNDSDKYKEELQQIVAERNYDEII